MHVLHTWFEHRSRMSKALDVLRVYAERNEEPPASVIQALTGLGSICSEVTSKAALDTRPPSRTRCRERRLRAGCDGDSVWWKAPDPTKPGGLVIFVILAGLVFCCGCSCTTCLCHLHARMTEDDAALIAEIRGGSGRAFNVLIDRHQQAVQGIPAAAARRRRGC